MRIYGNVLTEPGRGSAPSPSNRLTVVTGGTTAGPADTSARVVPSVELSDAQEFNHNCDDFGCAQ